MNTQKIFIINETTQKALETIYSAFCSASNHSVFATQTHIEYDRENIAHYVAYIFYREAN